MQQPTAPANRLFLTNNYSIVSKYSAVKNGYFADKVLERFIENWTANLKAWRRTALVNRGYAARMLAVDWMVGRCIQFESVDCIVVLGAGYDTLAFRQQRNRNCCWIELDLPQVIEEKANFIRQQRVLGDIELSQPEKGIFSSEDGRYHLVACDLRDSNRLTSSLELALSRAAGLRRNFVILNEVCLCYVDLKEIQTILKTVLGSLSKLAFRVHYIGYEQVRPQNCESQFSSVMLDHFHSIGHPIKYFPTHREIKELLGGELNFNHVTIANMYQIYHNALLASRLDIDAFHVEPFDEFEEMDLYLSHYALVTGILVLRDPFMFDLEKKIKEVIEQADLDQQLDGLMINQRSSTGLTSVPSQLQRFGHSACEMGNSIIVSGGFGKQNSPMKISDGSQDSADRQRHARIADCLLVSTDDEFTCKPADVSQFDGQSVCLDRMHGQLAKVGEQLLFFNGGRQSPANLTAQNVSFLAELVDGNRLKLVHQFSHTDSDQVHRWRHKLTPMLQSDQLLQLGGLSLAGEQHPLVLWNLSSSKLGCSHLSEPSSELHLFERHSFGSDMSSSNSLLVFGGLQTSQLFRDRPVEIESNALVWDMRTPSVTKLQVGEKSRCYGCQVHFINECQFVRLGGVSATTGVDMSTMELMDLRYSSGASIESVDVAELPAQQGGHANIPINLASVRLPELRKIVTLGGGGNYFTFGTKFNRTHLVCKY